jgi:putative (di)nucleoside polyphosphate hydrolase
MPRYRHNVCAVLRKAGTRLLLLCHRKGFPAEKGWQFPQGGIKKGADLISEMKRELREEIGTDDVRVTTVPKKWYTYTFPKSMKHKHDTYDGQVQQWVLAEFPGSDGQINFTRIPAEFDGFAWVTPQTALDRIVDFKKDVYTRAMTDLGLI